MIKRVTSVIVLLLIASGLLGCAQVEPDSAGVDLEPEVTFKGPAFVLFFTDP